MTPLAVAVVLGVLGVLLIGTVGALAARQLAFSYSQLVPLQFAVWAMAGVIAASSAPSIGTALTRGGTAGLLVGAVDSTLGWWLSRRIGPGMPAGMSESMLTHSILLVAASRVSLRAAALGGIAGALSAFVSSTS